MQAVTGVFSTQADAERAVVALRSVEVPGSRICMLVPGDVRNELKWVPVDTTEQPGMGKAIGAVLGAAGGLTGGSLLIAAVLPGVGLVTAAGLLGSAILGAAGAGVGAAVGGNLENAMTDGLPEDEIFVYEDALRQGRSVVIALAEDETAAKRLRELLNTEGAEAVDAARHQWWIGLRNAEKEHYSASGRDFNQDEKFYRLGFEAALHARTRCMEFDQASAEMESRIEDVQAQYPGQDVTEPFTQGYRRGRDYYQKICNEERAA